MDAQVWTRFNDKPCLHMRLVAWAMRRSDRREGRIRSLWRRLGA